MLDPRIYRAAFLPLLFALVVVGFSVREQPRAETTTLAPDAFDGAAAFRQVDALATAAPRRRPGSPGDRLVAARVREGLRANGFRVRTRTFEGQTVDGERALETVTGERTGFSNRRIIVIAHRDALGTGARAELSGTAALLELARVLGGRTLNRTLVLASTSGGSGGAAGAAQLAGSPGGPVDAVIALGDLAGRRVDRPVVVPWAQRSVLASLELRRTVEAAVFQETGIRPGGERTTTQISRLAAPLALGEQGPFGARGISAVLVSASGERPAAASAPVAEARLNGLGRAVLRSVTALDAGRDIPRANAYVLLERKLLPAWPVRLLSAALLLPVLLATVDALARVRRRREPVGMWLRWVGVCALPFATTALFVGILRWTGLLDAAPDGIAPAGAIPIDAAVLASVLLVLVASWLLLRPFVQRLAGVRGDVAAPGAAAAVMLALCGVALGVWLANPFACLLLVPALHLWLFAVAPELRLRRLVPLALFLGGLIVPLLVAYGYARQFSFGPLEWVWGALLLLAGGALGLPAVVGWCLLLGCAAAALAILLRGAAGGPDAEAPITVRGPTTYAGPGSLGGTESALRR